MKYISTFILLILLIGIASGVNTTTSLIWTATIGSPITSIDTNEYGTIVVAGLDNGSIVAYDNNGNWKWQYQTNDTIKKVISDATGNIAWSNSLNETGYIQYSGASLSYHNDTYRNISDISISKDGSTYAFTELYPPRISISYSNGTYFSQNTSYPNAQWSGIAVDPLNTWLVTSNQTSNRLYLWAVSNYSGWNEFNPTLTYNSSLRFIDSFPYRRNLSIASYSNYTDIKFGVNITNTTDILKINESWYEYNNQTTGNYFYVSTPGNFSNRLSEYVNYTTRDPNTGLMHIAFKPNWKNFTLYYGNMTYNGTYEASGAGSVIYTSGSGSLTVPPYITSMTYRVIGGGGSGAAGGNAIVGANGNAGNGGSAGTILTGTLSGLTPGNSLSYSVGAGGAMQTPHYSVTATVGNNGINSSVGGTINAAGGNGGTITGSPPTSGASGWGTAVSSGAAGSIEYYCYDTCYAPGLPGSLGYGAGGAGSGVAGYTSQTGYAGGTGGYGAPGYISLTWSAATIYYGKAPTYTIFPVAREERNSPTFLTYVTSYAFVGNVSGMSVPENGGWIALSTDAPKVYHQAMSPTAFGTQYSAVANTGNSYAIAVSDGASFSTEGRGIVADIYDATGTRKGSYTSGGTIRSVDIAQKTSLWSIAGGDDGKVYIFSKDALASWYVAYSGDSLNPITSTAFSWRGEYAAAGRTDGNLEYYSTNYTTASVTSFDVTGNVYKDAMIYPNQNITVYRSDVLPYSWTLAGSGITDSNGRFSYSVVANMYYKFIVNANEGETIYQASAAVPKVVINILSPNIPYEWSSSYDPVTGNVTVIYTDSITSPYVNVSITDMSTGQVVATTVFTNGNSAYTYHDVSGSGTYQVTAWISRNGNIVRDQRMVVNPKKYGIILPVDNYLKWGLSMLALMVIAGLFGAMNSKRGALAVVAIAAVMIFIGLLPLQMWTVTMLAAMLAVSSLLGSKGV